MRTFKLMVVLALALALMVPGLSFAEEGKAFKEYPKIVDQAFVQEIIDLKKPGLIVDTRPKRGKYDVGHIPGAINIPTEQLEQYKGVLPSDKAALLVFYCQGLKCGLSHKAAFMAEKWGYTNVSVYAKGYPDWKTAQGPGCGDPDAGSSRVLLIEGNANVAKVREFLTKEGLESGAQAQTGAFKPGRLEGSIDLAQFEELMKTKPDSVILVDSREAAEFQKGSLPTAINIEAKDLEKKLPEWKVEKPVVFFCNTGAKSGEEFWMTKDLRPDLKDVYYVDGEFTFDGKGGFTLKANK